MAVKATDFTEFSGDEADRLKGLEAEIDAGLRAEMERAIKAGDDRMDHRHPFPSNTPLRLKMRLHRLYREQGWTVGWADARTALWLRAEVEPKK